MPRIGETLWSQIPTRSAHLAFMRTGKKIDLVLQRLAKSNHPLTAPLSPVSAAMLVVLHTKHHSQSHTAFLIITTIRLDFTRTTTTGTAEPRWMLAYLHATSSPAFK